MLRYLPRWPGFRGPNVRAVIDSQARSGGWIGPYCRSSASVTDRVSASRRRTLDGRVPSRLPIASLPTAQFASALPLRSSLETFGGCQVSGARSASLGLLPRWFPWPSGRQRDRLTLLCVLGLCSWWRCNPVEALRFLSNCTVPPPRHVHGWLDLIRRLVVEFIGAGADSTRRTEPLQRGDQGNRARAD